MLQKSIMNRNRIYFKKTSRNYRNKKYIMTEKKIAGGLNSIMEMTKDRTSELEDRTVELPNLNRENTD